MMYEREMHQVAISSEPTKTVISQTAATHLLAEAIHVIERTDRH